MKNKSARWVKIFNLFIIFILFYYSVYFKNCEDLRYMFCYELSGFVFFLLFMYISTHGDDAERQWRLTILKSLSNFSSDLVNLMKPTKPFQNLEIFSPSVAKSTSYAVVPQGFLYKLLPEYQIALVINGILGIFNI